LSEERTFLNDNQVYVSNTRVVIQGTTYSTANITSVRKTITPAKTGCAAVLAILGVVFALSGAAVALQSEHGDGVGMIVFGVIALVVGILWLRSLKPTHHVMLASASGERQGLSSQDESLVNRVTTAIADAITFRG
jgi:hypothetical protein